MLFVLNEGDTQVNTGLISQTGLIHTNNKCTGCNRCIKVCNIPGVNVFVKNPATGQEQIKVNNNWCIACGACLDACDHNARDYEDDTARFFEDLNAGVPITLLVAPAFKANYPEEYERILGGLKTLGIQHIISVSFGADLALWAYLKYIETHEFSGSITNPCPVVVSYIEKYEPGLIPMLSPVQTPLMCTAIYARKQLGLQERFAFLSPCIAKKSEIENPQNRGLVQYNVTFKRFMQYVREHNIYGESCSDEVEYDLGTIYPMPGGLSEYARWLLGEDLFIRQIEGVNQLFGFLHANAKRIADGYTPFSFIDALNCKQGCLCGTAVEHKVSMKDDVLYNLARIRQTVKRDSKLTALTPKERRMELDRRFSDIDLTDYLIIYENKSPLLALSEPTAEELEAIFHEMGKDTEEAKVRNCSACGYHSCREMAKAIFNGLNRKENCVYFLHNSIEKQNKQLRYLAEHDEQLDIYNRRKIMSRISELPPGTQYAIVMAEVNGFRDLNEFYGQKEVDSILLQLTEALKKNMITFDGIVGRGKSDEFIILFIGKKLEAQSPEIRAIADAMESRIKVGEGWLNLTASIGVVNSDHSHGSESCLDCHASENHLDCAEMAVGAIKTFDRTTVLFYDDELRKTIEEERETKELLIDAIEKDGFYMMYQPQVEVDTKNIHGYEALVRMRAPDMYPGKFIPVAEKNGLIWKIGRITTELVIRQIAEWIKNGYDVHPVSINFSSMQLSDEAYLDFLKSMLKKYGVPSNLVEIEITESLFIGKTDQAISLFNEFKAQGIRLLMDDFGTGYSSLGYLSYIPVDVIKIDKSLVDTYLVEGQDHLIDNVISLFHDLGKQIIVEGVETKDQTGRLSEFGADIIQGYYFSKPLLPEEAIRFRAL